MEDFATHRVISDIPTNLRFYGISSDFWRISRLGMETFPSARETLRMAGKRPSDATWRVPISEKGDAICEANGYFPYF